jgi:hypothetical protein
MKFLPPFVCAFLDCSFGLFFWTLLDCIWSCLVLGRGDRLYVVNHLILVLTQTA